MTVPPAATPRMMAIEFARFLGLPVIRRANMTDIIEAVCGVCDRHPASMVAVDEIHNMQPRHPQRRRGSDMLKYSPSGSPPPSSTPGSTSSARAVHRHPGSQIAGRFRLIPTLPFPSRRVLAGLVATLEDSLRLHRHQPGTLAGLEEYLHRAPAA